MKRILIAFIFAVGIGWGVYQGVNSLMPEDTILGWDRAGIILGYAVTCLTVGTAVTAAFSLGKIKEWIRRVITRRRFEGLGTPFDPIKEKVNAIIIPVSRKEQPEWIMRHLKPRYMGLVFTEKTRKDAEDHMQTARTLGIEPISGTEGLERGLSDSSDPARNREIARLMIDTAISQGVPPSQIFVDTTGGTVPMSIGLFQAAEEAGVSTIYVEGTVNGIIKDPLNPAHGRPIFISDHTEDTE